MLKREATQASGLQGQTGSSAGLELETSGREKKPNQDLENSGMIQDNYLWPSRRTPQDGVHGTKSLVYISGLSQYRTNIQSQLTVFLARQRVADECEHRQHAYNPPDDRHKHKHGSEDGRSGS